jgi:hypothetical protein
LIGPPRLQCQQFAVHEWVISKETERGFFLRRFRIPPATIFKPSDMLTFGICVLLIPGS